MFNRGGLVIEMDLKLKSDREPSKYPAHAISRLTRLSARRELAQQSL